MRRERAWIRFARLEFSSGHHTQTLIFILGNNSPRNTPHTLGRYVDVGTYSDDRDEIITVHVAHFVIRGWNLTSMQMNLVK